MWHIQFQFIFAFLKIILSPEDLFPKATVLMCITGLSLVVIQSDGADVSEWLVECCSC
jgi:hypothetical protein